MKKLLVAFGLCATLLSSLSMAARPAGAAPAMPPLNIVETVPDPQDLQVRAIAPLNRSFILLPRAELTSQVFLANTWIPQVKKVYCYVKNSGHKHSGWFKTLIRVKRPWLPAINVYAPMALPAGAHTWVSFYVLAPTGVQSVYSFADVTYLVKEYNEFNNGDSIP